jgi:hypothetical protein
LDTLSVQEVAEYNPLRSRATLMRVPSSPAEPLKVLVCLPLATV